MRAFIAMTTAVCTLMAPLAAHAQCKTDVECKGERVCEGGQCVNPAGEPPPPPAPPPDDGVNVTYAEEPVKEADYSSGDAGWATAAGIIGFISGAVVLSLSVASDLTKEDQVPSLPLGVSAILLIAAMGPVVFAGGKSARSGGGGGLVGLRVLGWITYGVSIGVGLLLALVGSLDLEPPDGIISATGLIGAVSMVSFGVDAMVSAADATSVVSNDGWRPSIGLAVDNDLRRLPTLGAAVSF